MSDEQEDQWDEAYNAMKEGFQKSDANKVGHVRNGFGMAMSGVYVMNDPGAWIKETLEMEVAAQGGRVVASPAGADLVVGGTIPWLEVDMYMSYWADLIVDVELAPKGRPVVRRSFHTHGSKTAWSSSSFEYYQPVRMCEQKFMVLLIREMGDVVSR